MELNPPPDRVAASENLGGRYQLGAELGRGGMGVVRAGRDLRLQRDVAVKVLHPEMAAQAGIRERFVVEARAAASLVHPHVVAVFDSGEDAGIPFLVMERLAGRTLADAIDAGPMDPEAVRQLGLQVLDALSAAHASGLIHRDIKPANLLDAGPGKWKVGDFGIAKSIEGGGADLTSTGLIVGTPAYLAPERLAGGAATPSSDLYALGVVLHQALVGRRGGPSAPPASGAWQPLPTMDQVRPGLPTDVVAAVTRALAPDPTARFSSASEMAASLRAHEIPGSMGRTPALLSPPAPTEIFRGPAPHEAPARRVGRSLRRPRVLLCVLAACVVLGLLVVVEVTSGGHGAATGPAASTSAPVPAQPAAQPPTSLPAPLADALQRLEQAVRP